MPDREFDKEKVAPKKEKRVYLNLKRTSKRKSQATKKIIKLAIRKAKLTC